MIELNKLPAWIVNADKDLIKYRQQQQPKPEPVLSTPPTPEPQNPPQIKEEVNSIKPVKNKKKVEKYHEDTDEEDCKPKKKEIC